MIKFKKNVQGVLPYNREEYLNSLDEDINSSIKWYGVSVQLNKDKERKNLKAYIDTFESVLKNIVLKLDNGTVWVVNHEDKDLDWFPNDVNNLTLLRSLFKQKNISYSFRGALIFMKNDLLEFTKDLISYPHVVLNGDSLLYKNLDISHGQLQFIIKISGHLTVDLLSTDKALLTKVINDNFSSLFSIKEYRGTSLYL